MCARAVDRVEVTPLAVRLWHWAHALGVVALLASGAAIRFPDAVRWFGDYRSAVNVHDVVGVVVSGSFLVWLLYYGLVARRLRKVYLPTREDLWPGLVRQGVFYFWGYFRGAPHPYQTGPERRFNPLQKIAYAAVMLVLTPLACATGLLLVDVTALRQWLVALGGLKLVIGAHFLLGAAFLAFIFVHVYLSTMGHTPGALFRTMWTGWEEQPPQVEVDRGRTRGALMMMATLASVGPVNAAWNGGGSSGAHPAPPQREGRAGSTGRGPQAAVNSMSPPGSM